MFKNGTKSGTPSLRACERSGRDARFYLFIEARRGIRTPRARTWVRLHRMSSCRQAEETRTRSRTLEKDKRISKKRMARTSHRPTGRCCISRQKNIVFPLRNIRRKLRRGVQERLRFLRRFETSNRNQQASFGNGPPYLELHRTTGRKISILLSKDGFSSFFSLFAKEKGLDSTKETYSGTCVPSYHKGEVFS